MGLLNKANKTDTTSTWRDSGTCPMEIIFPTNRYRSEVRMIPPLMDEIKHLQYKIKRMDGMGDPYELMVCLRDFLVYNPDSNCIIIKTAFSSSSESRLHIIFWKDICVGRKWWGGKKMKRMSVFDVAVWGLPEKMDGDYTPISTFFRNCLMDKNTNRYEVVWIPDCDGGMSPDLSIEWIYKRMGKEL